MNKVMLFISMLIFNWGHMAGITEAGPADANTSELIINITGFESSDGVARIMMVNSKESYDNGVAFKATQIPIVGQKLMQTAIVPYGEYAIRVYHDENNNSKLDKTMFGIPKEKFGFSNNARATFGPPEYEAVAFNINSPKSTITVEVQ